MARRSTGTPGFGGQGPLLRLTFPRNPFFQMMLQRPDSNTPNPERAPFASVVVPCRNESGHIEKCLKNILAQQSVHGGFEVIVADGRSEDGTRDLVSKIAEGDSRVRLIDNPGLIASTGLNAAIRAAKGRIIVRMDAHTEYSDDYINRCAALLHRTGADNVGGPARTKGETYMERAVRSAFHCPLVVGGARFHNVDFEGYVDTVAYGCWPRQTFDQFGLFDEELVRNQDDEFNLRILRGGGRIWQSPDVKSWYHPRKTLGALWTQYAQYGYWKVRVIQKHHLPASWRHIVPAGFLLTFAATGALSLVSKMALTLFALVSISYTLVVLAASIWSCFIGGWSSLPVLPVVVACFQLGYGYGFLSGLWDFVVRRGGARQEFTQLTR